MSTQRLQITLDKKVIDKAKQRTAAKGTNINDLVRVFIYNLAHKEFDFSVSFNDREISLEREKKLKEFYNESKASQSKAYTNADDMIKDLME